MKNVCSMNCLTERREEETETGKYNGGQYAPLSSQSARSWKALGDPTSEMGEAGPLGSDELSLRIVVSSLGSCGEHRVPHKTAHTPHADYL